MIYGNNVQDAHVSRYVDVDASVNLDSADAFEGPEKLLEVWYAPSAKDLPKSFGPTGLRGIPRDELYRMLSVVQCKVLSEVSTDLMDAYLLSESSMFVFPHKLILKTCGTTTLIPGVVVLLELVSKYCKFSDNPWRVFYSRKKFMFPECQKRPHRSWNEEVASLNACFANGRSYMVGDTNDDYWHLYTSSSTPVTNSLFSKQPKPLDALQDHTIEIMMTGLSPVHTAQFYTDRYPGQKKGSAKQDSADDEEDVTISDSSSPLSTSSITTLTDDASGKDQNEEDDLGHDMGTYVTKAVGIDRIYAERKDQTIDSFIFTPCGYSCNGIVGDSNYFTIHVTPEVHCSYASFESNLSPENCSLGLTNIDVIERVVNIFRPAQFSVALFESTSNKKSEDLTNKILSAENLDGYVRVERVIQELDGYILSFLSFRASRLK